MPTLNIEVTDEVANALAFQARALLLGRRMYIRAVLAAVAAQANRRGHIEPDGVTQEAHQ
jgi:hypothetical protein